MAIEYRVENKYLLTDQMLVLLLRRLAPAMERDIHQEGSCYEVRSLYFDDAWDRCMDENDAGVDAREKYRIRIYDPASDVIHLEIKEKFRGFTRKKVCDLTKEEYRQILEGTLPLTMDHREPLNRLRLQMRCHNLRPKVIIRYERTAFVCTSGNVRITFDRNISASRYCGDFFEDQIRGITPVLPAGMHLLEVKYDTFLPDHLAGILETGKLRQTAFSKYYLGRLVLDGELSPGCF